MRKKTTLKYRFNYCLISDKYKFTLNIILNVIRNTFIIIIIVFFKIKKKSFFSDLILYFLYNKYHIKT